MLASLDKLAALPDATQVYCGHEYTTSNLRFARAVEPGSAVLVEREKRAQAKRAQGLPTLPSMISEERLTNPFLRVREPAVRAAHRAHAGRALDSAVIGVRRAARLEEQLLISRRVLTRPLAPSCVATYHRGTLPVTEPIAAAAARGRDGVHLRARARVLLHGSAAIRRSRSRWRRRRSGRRRRLYLSWTSPVEPAPVFFRAGSDNPDRCRRRDRCRSSSNTETSGSASAQGFAVARSRIAGGQVGRKLVRRAPGLRGADGRSQPALPLLHRRRGPEAWHAHRSGAAAHDRERVQPDGVFEQPRVGHLAVHPVDREGFRPRADLVARRAPRRRRGD